MGKDTKPAADVARPFAVGDFYGFRLFSPPSHSPPDRARYGAFRVFEVIDAGSPGANGPFRFPNSITIATLQGVFHAPPTLDEVANLPVQIWAWPQGAFSGRPAVFVVLLGVQPPGPLVELRWLGNVALTAAERSWFDNLPPTPKPFGGWWAIGWRAQNEWLWEHDRERLAAETERDEEERGATDAAAAQRNQARLKGLTWERLLSETHFERWKDSPPFPPPEFTAAARAEIERTIRSLAALGPKPQKAAVRAELRKCIDLFNAADTRAGEVIETEEREDVMLLLADICSVARHRSLIEEIDAWRTW